METAQYTYRKHEDVWLGFLDAFPDYQTQGATFEELQENLCDLHNELTSGAIPQVRRTSPLRLG